MNIEQLRAKSKQVQIPNLYSVHNNIQQEPQDI